MASEQGSLPLLARFPHWRTDRMAFRREAILLEDGRPFGEVIEPWQAEDFMALDDPRHRHAYLERPRGHSKTGDIGTEAVVELVLGRPNMRLFCVAADEDQARLLFEDVWSKFERSPLLRPLVKRTRQDITAKPTGSRLTVLAADAPSAYGLRPDWIAADELAEWRSRGLWDSLWTATGKRTHCRMMIISTAGWDRAGIAWEVRAIAEQEANWYFSSRGQCASWIDPAWLAQQQRTLPSHVFARLHENRWVEGAGAFLLASEVEQIFQALPPPAPGRFMFGLDLGITKDCSALALVRMDESAGVACVEALLTWEPESGGRVDLRQVETETLELVRKLPAPIVVDPWQAVLLAQRLREAGCNVIEFPFTSENRRKLFGTLLDLIRHGRLRAEPHEELRRELLGLEVQETAAGWRVDHKVGRHDDHVVAVALAVMGLASISVISVTSAQIDAMDAELEQVDKWWRRFQPGYDEKMKNFFDNW